MAVYVSTFCRLFDHFQYFHLQILVSIGTWWSLLNVDYYLACSVHIRNALFYPPYSSSVRWCGNTVSFVIIYNLSVEGARFAITSGKCEQKNKKIKKY